MGTYVQNGHSGDRHPGRNGQGGAPNGTPGGDTESGAGGSMWLTKVAIQRPWLMLMAITSVLIFGVIGYTRMGVELFPEVNFPLVVVNVAYPGASPEVIESQVTRPLEDAVAGLADLDRVDSFSSESVAVLTVIFTDKADPKTVAIEVEKRINAARSKLPTDALAPTISKLDFGAQPIMNLTLSGDRPQEQLYDIANNRVRTRLEAVDGVAQATIAGGRQREVQVNVDPSRLRAYGLTLQQVSGALSAENITMPGGTVDGATRNYALRVDAKFRNARDVEDTVVFAAPAGGNVRVRDVAQVVEGFKRQTVFSRVDGTDAVSLSIQKESSSNVTGVASGVRKEVDLINTQLPDGVQVKIITDESTFITNSLNGVQRSLIEAVVLTGLVLLVFLHSWRSTFIVLLAIPTSLIATFGVMWLQGFTLNFLSTLALALTVGILVDDSIVVLENIFRHLQMGKSPQQAAIDGRSEIGMAAIAITLVDVVVFTPVALMTGQIGQFFRQFGFTVVAATLFSLAVSFTLTPLLASRWLRVEDEHGTGWLAAFGKRWDRMFAGIERFYGRFLARSLRWRWLVVLGAFGALVLGMALPAMGIVKSEFFPQQDNGYFFVTVELAPGNNATTTGAAAARVEEKMLKVPEVETVFTSVGRGLGGGTGGDNSHTATMTVKLKEKDHRTRTSQQVALEAGTFAAGMPGVRIEAAVEGAGGGTKPIQINVFGNDLQQLDRQAEQVMSSLTALGTLTNIANSGKQGSPEYVISIDRQKAADLGLSAAQVASTVRTAYAGSVATQLRQDSATAATGTATDIDIRVQLTEDVRHDLDRLVDVPLLSPARGGQVLLGQVATINPSTTLGQIQRRDKQRMLTISAAVAEGRVLGEVTPQVEATLRGLTWPDGTSYKMGGEAEQQQDTFQEFFMAIGLSVLLTYMLLVALYESPVYPIVVLLALPLALVGAMAGLAISRETLNLFSLIGVIMLTGLVGKNSILVVDYANQLRKQGMSRTEALLHAGPARLRPILMTSAAMIFAQIPLALKLEEGSEVQAPLAVVVMGGMITSTFLALIFVPSMYTLVDDFQNLVVRLFRWVTRAGKKPAAPTTPSVPGTPTDSSPDSDKDVTPGIPARKDETMNGPIGEEAKTPNRRLIPAGVATANSAVHPEPVEGHASTGSARTGRKLAGVNSAALAAGTLLTGTLLLSACGSVEPAKAAPAPAPVSVAITEVKRDTVRSTFEASGAVEATDSVAVLPKGAGRVVTLNGEVGQRVQAGQVLAQLEHYTLDLQVAQAEAGLESARARLAQLERGPRTEEVAMAAAQRDAAAAQAQAVAAQAQGAASQAQGAANQAQAAAAQATAAAQGISTLDAQIKAAGEQAAAALASAQAARTRVEALKNPRAEDLQVLQGQINLAKIRLAQSQSRDEEIKIAATQVELARVQLQQAQEGNRPEAIKAAQTALDQAEVALTNVTQMPVRAEDLAIAKMSIEAGDAGYRAAQASLGDAIEARNQAKTQSDNLSPFMSRTQADLQLAQAEANVNNVQAQIEQRRIQRDQARATYEKLESGATDWDVRQAQLRVEQAKAQLDLTKNPDPARVKAAALSVEQAQAGLDAKRKQIAFDLQSADEGVKTAEAQLSKLANPSQYDVQAAEEQASAAEAQASAARAQIEVLVSQKSGTEVSTQAAAGQAAAAADQAAAAASQVGAARGQAEAAAANVRNAEAALALRRNPVTAEDLRVARAAVQQAQAALDAIASTRQDAVITAPVSGVIGTKSASVGTMAAPQAPLFTIVSDGVEVTLPVEETKVSAIRPGQQVTLTSAAFPGESFAGTVTSLTPGADARSRTFTARIRPSVADGRLRPGMFVQAAIQLDERAQVPVVSRDALIQRDGKTNVYVVTADNRAELRPIRVGLLSGQLAEIVEGLNPGDKVVTTGLEDIRAGTLLSPASR